MVRLINIFKLFTNCAEIEMQHMLMNFNFLQLKKGDIILKEEDVCTNLWFVVSGCIMLVTNTKQAGKIIELYTSNYIFTEIVSYVNNTPTEFCLEAVIDTELYCISKSAFEKLNNRSINWHMFRVKLLENVCQYMTSEIVNLKVYTNKERYNKLLDKRPFLFQLLPQYIIANYLDMTPVGLSKLRGRLTGQSYKAA